MVALVEADAGAIERELALDVCVWWKDAERLSSMHGPAPVAAAFVRLMQERGAERLTTRPTSEGSVLVSALVRDRLAWSIELRPTGSRFSGAIVRGAAIPTTRPAA